MAIDFVKDTANYLTYPDEALSARIAGASKVVLSCIVVGDSFAGGSSFNNRLLTININDTQTGIGFGINNAGGNPFVRLHGRSVGGETEEIIDSTNEIVPSAITHVGGIFDFGGDTLSVFLNGVIDNSAAVTFNNTTFTDATTIIEDRIGAGTGTPPVVANQFDGRVQEFGIWALGASDVWTTGMTSALGNRYTPDQVFESKLVFYERFLKTPPIDQITRLAGTITGTLNYASHIPMRTRRREIITTSVISTAVVPPKMASYRRRRAA